MKMKLQLAAIVLLVLVGSCGKASIDNASLLATENVSEVEEELMGIVNEHRVSLNLNLLQFDEVAYEYANIHTRYMISKGEINHDHFESRAAKMSTKVEVSKISENVARNYTSAIGAFEEWLSSKAHRETIEGNFTHTAVSVKKDKDGNYYYTQLFFR